MVPGNQDALLKMAMLAIFVKYVAAKDDSLPINHFLSCVLNTLIFRDAQELSTDIICICVLEERKHL